MAKHTTKKKGKGKKTVAPAGLKEHRKGAGSKVKNPIKELTASGKSFMMKGKKVFG